MELRQVNNNNIRFNICLLIELIVTLNLQDLTEFLDRWKPYKFLWKNERSMRELLQISLSEFETTLRKHSELEDRLATEPDMIIFGTSIAVSTEKLKYGVYTEIKGNTNVILFEYYNYTFTYLKLSV